MARLLIGEVAKLLGVTTKTIRYYEEIGLLDEPERTEAGYRLYHPQELLQFFRIKQMQRLGLSLEHIRSLLHEPDRDRSFHEILRTLDAEITAQISELEARREQIRELLTQERMDILKQPGSLSPTLKLLQEHLGEQMTFDMATAIDDENLFAQLDVFLWNHPEYREQQQELIQHMAAHPQAWSQLADVVARIASLDKTPAESEEVEKLAEEVARLREENPILVEMVSSAGSQESAEQLGQILTGRATAELSASQRRLFHLVGMRWGHSKSGDVSSF